MYEEPVPEERVIVVRLWWELLGAGAVAMRARVTCTGNGFNGSTSAASTIDGIIEAVSAAVGQFLASRSTGSAGADE